MAVPKQKQTRSRTHRRRAGHALKGVAYALCPKCKEPVFAHRACLNCGTYAGKEAIDVFSKLDKKEKKKKEKEIEEQGQKGDMSMEEMSKS